jgi:hypothetical protein
MNYTNYERSIVELYSIELQGFPGVRIVNPGSLPKRSEVQALLKLLEGNVVG